jgi:phosphatidylglycerophosphatase C
MERKRPAALFDFDGTLARGDSILPFTGFVMRRYPRALVELPRITALFGPYGLGMISKERMKTVVLQILRHVPRDHHPRLGEAFFEEVLRPRLFAEGLARVRWHREQGHLLVLASASVDFYMATVLRELAFDVPVFTRTTLEPRPAIVGPNCYGAEKVRRLQALPLFAETDWEASWAYSDHASDVPMMQLCGNKIATTPHRKLRAFARQNGWQIVDWD